MKSEDMPNSAAHIRNVRSGRESTAPKRKKRWIGAAAVLVIAVLGGIFLRSGGGSSACAIAQAEYPKMARFPSGLSQFSDRAYDSWWADVKAQRRELGDISDLRTFFAKSAQSFLSGETGENRVYSPLNVYMALSMLAQITDGESREQILTLLGSDGIDRLRQRASDVWNANYRDDGAVVSVLANSLWLNRNVTYDRDTLDTLAESFYASSYRGEMGSEKFNEALRSWLNEQTGGLLEKQAGSIGLDSEAVLTLASTVYFRAKWYNEFSGDKTALRTFHAPTGDMETHFMFQRDDQAYYWGERFAAVSQQFEEGGAMWFILPDEGTSPEALLLDSEAADFLFSTEKSKWENQKLLFVNKSIPKFDISSQFDLDEGLKRLGVTDIFDWLLSDFTPLTANADVPIILSQASHAARVVIDEEGCTAMAFTFLPGVGAAPPPDDEVDFVLDRPFLFCITGDSGLPLFVGVVNCPTGR